MKIYGILWEPMDHLQLLALPVASANGNWPPTALTRFARYITDGPLALDITPPDMPPRNAFP